MKVICINNEDDNTAIKGLTQGKMYEVVTDSITNYHRNTIKIVNDLNESLLYPVYRFRTLEEYRDEIISDILKK